MIVYTMPKSRIMSAGTVGTSKRIRVNGPEGGGNKLQGLPPICNMRSPLVPFVRTRADGENRNVVFCINQLSGGVGAKRGQFGPGNRAGVGQTGGCGKPTPPWWYGHPAILNAFQVLDDFIRHHSSYNPNGISNPSTTFAFIGDHESLLGDHVVPAPGYSTDPSWLFSLLPPATGEDTVDNAINLLNSMKLQFPVNGKMQPHEIGIVGKEAHQRLIEKGYIRIIPVSNTLDVLAFGDAQSCANPSSGATVVAGCGGAYIGYTYTDPGDGKKYICKDDGTALRNKCLCCNTGPYYLTIGQNDDGTPITKNPKDQCGFGGSPNNCDVNPCVSCAGVVVASSGGGGGGCCWNISNPFSGCPIWNVC